MNLGDLRRDLRAHDVYRAIFLSDTGSRIAKKTRARLSARLVLAEEAPDGNIAQWVSGTGALQREIRRHALARRRRKRERRGKFARVVASPAGESYNKRKSTRLAKVIYQIPRDAFQHNRTARINTFAWMFYFSERSRNKIARLVTHFERDFHWKFVHWDIQRLQRRSWPINFLARKSRRGIHCREFYAPILWTFLRGDDATQTRSSIIHWHVLILATDLTHWRHIRAHELV